MNLDYELAPLHLGLWREEHPLVVKRTRRLVVFDDERAPAYRSNPRLCFGGGDDATSPEPPAPAPKPEPEPDPVHTSAPAPAPAPAHAPAHAPAFVPAPLSSWGNKGDHDRRMFEEEEEDDYPEAPRSFFPRRRGEHNDKEEEDAAAAPSPSPPGPDVVGASPPREAHKPKKMSSGASFSPLLPTHGKSVCFLLLCIRWLLELLSMHGLK